MKSLITIIILFLILFTNNAGAQSVLSLNRASQTSSGTGVNADVGLPDISPNSDKIVFASQASNLVADDTNGEFDIFLKDLATGTVTRITDAGVINPNTGKTIESNGDSRNPSISPSTANGGFAIAFQSRADNIARKRLKFPDNNDVADIFLSVPKRSNFLERISVGPGGIEPDDQSEQASITALPLDKQILVAYASLAKNLTNLASPDPDDTEDVFLAAVTLPDGDVFDPSKHISTERISMGLNGDLANGKSLNPAISVDGSVIAFESLANNLVSTQTAPTVKQIYLWERATKTLTLISKDSNGNPGNGRSQDASVSYNGKFISYTTRATNIINDGYVPVGDYLQIFLYNRETGETTRVNASSSGIPGNGSDGFSSRASISPDGRFVLFSDSSTNLVSDDTNGTYDVFIKDMATSNVVRVSKKPGGPESNAASVGPTFAKTSYNSQTGRATYTSLADNLISNDTEGRADIFFSSLSIPPLPFSKDTKIEVPPDFSLNENNKKAIITLQPFSGVTAKARALETSAAKTEKLRYQIRLTQTDGPKKKRDIRTIYSKKNELAVKGLKPGNYNLKYRAETVKNDKVIQKSPYSPTISFTTVDD